MGFWSNFLGNVVGHTYNDIQKQNRENKSWNDLFFEISDYEQVFNDFLDSIGCTDQYTFDVSAVNNGNIVPEKRKIDECRKKVNEYLSLGGKGEYIHHIEEIDDYIKKIKILKKERCVDRQDEFAFHYANEVEEALREEKNMLKSRQKNKAFNFTSNEIDNNQKLEIKNVKIWDGEEEKFYDFTVRITCDTIAMNMYLEANPVVPGLEEGKLLGSFAMTKGDPYEVKIMDFDDAGLSKVVVFCNTIHVMNTNDAIKFKFFHESFGDNQAECDLPRNINHLSGVEFERVCQQIVENMGFETQMTKASGDGGIDLIAYNYQPLLSGKYIIQCKRYSGSVGEPIIRDLYGVVTAERANKGILMTTGHFTKSAIAFAEGKPIELIDGVRLNELLMQYNLCLKNDISNIEDDILVSSEFDPAPFMGYYYDDYIAAKKQINQGLDEIQSRCTMIEIIHQSIKMRLGLFELGDVKPYVINAYDIQQMLKLLRNNLQELLKYDYSQSTNKRLQTVFYTAMLIDGEASILSGDFVSAVERFGTVLRDWKDLRTNEHFITDILYSLFGVFRLSNNSEMIAKYYSKYKYYIDFSKKHFEEMVAFSSFVGEFEVGMLETINNPYDSTMFITISSDDFYDTCLDDWGDINISRGSYRMDVNHEKNWLFYCGAKNWISRSQETVLIESYNSIVACQKELVTHIAQRFI